MKETDMTGCVKVKKLCETDREQLMGYVSLEPEMNLFFVGDIENYGLESETVSVYAFPDGDEWDCVLLRYFDMYIVYSRRKNFHAEMVAGFLQEHQVESISGKTELVRQLQPYYPNLRLKETYLCRCSEAGMRAVMCDKNSEKITASQETGVEKGSCANTALSEGRAEIRPLAPEECPKIVELYREIAEFPLAHDNPEKAQKTMEADFASGELAVGIFEKGLLTAIARTSGSNSSSFELLNGRRGNKKI